MLTYVQYVRIIKVNADSPDEKVLKIAGEVARRGGLVAFPTETVYGLGTNAFKEDAVKRLFEVKRRPPSNPISILISNLESAYNLAEINRIASKLMKEFFPGPLTVVMRAREEVPNIVTAGTGKVAVRMPDHPIALKIVEFAEVPLATPSANVSGRPSPTKAEHVIQDFRGKIDLLIDGGETGIGIESTVVDTTTDPPKILRLGAIAVEDIERVIGKVVVAKAESMKYPHYKPKAKLIVVFQGDLEGIVERFRSKGKRVGVALKRRRDIDADVVIELGDDAKTYAKRLFDALRMFDDVDVGVVEGLDEKGGLAKAIRSRLIKAADEVIE